MSVGLGQMSSLCTILRQDSVSLGIGKKQPTLIQAYTVQSATAGYKLQATYMLPGFLKG